MGPCFNCQLFLPEIAVHTISIFFSRRAHSARGATQCHTRWHPVVHSVQNMWCTVWKNLHFELQKKPTITTSHVSWWDQGWFLPIECVRFPGVHSPRQPHLWLRFGGKGHMCIMTVPRCAVSQSVCFACVYGWVWKIPGSSLDLVWVCLHERGNASDKLKRVTNCPDHHDPQPGPHR